jgi:DNA-directed RNA polymerase subunit E'
MYKILKVRDKIRVPPSKFRHALEKAVQESLEERWEGVIEKELGVVLSVVSVENIGEGKILPGDGAIYYPTEFKILTYFPEMHEIVKGQVIDVTEFGVFVRIGPLDGMIHVSQIMNDFVSYDAKNSIFSGRESKRLLKEGDTVVARIVSVSLGQKQYKIGLTTRQPGLGVPSWLKIEKKDNGERKARGTAKRQKKAEK